MKNKRIYKNSCEKILEEGVDSVTIYALNNKYSSKATNHNSHEDLKLTI